MSGVYFAAMMIGVAWLCVWSIMPKPTRQGWWPFEMRADETRMADLRERRKSWTTRKAGRTAEERALATVRKWQTKPAGASDPTLGANSPASGWRERERSPDRPRSGPT
jgi:hypothetical protein